MLVIRLIFQEKQNQDLRLVFGLQEQMYLQKYLARVVLIKGFIFKYPLTFFFVNTDQAILILDLGLLQEMEVKN